MKSRSSRCHSVGRVGIGAGGLVICRFPRLVDEIAAEQVANMTAVLAVPALIEALEEASIALALAWQITKRDDLRAWASRGASNAAE